MVEKGSIRKAYGQALAEYGAINPGVVVLDADVSSSTQTHIFAKLFPDRFFNVGINTFAALLALRALEQIRTCVAYARTNVKLVAGYAGLSDFKDGVTHNCICDLAIMRAMPNLAVVVAADAVEVQKMVPVVAEYDGPVYFRVSRTDWPVIFGNTHEVEIGKGVVLRDGRDVTLIGTGLMVYRCIRAAEVLAEEGIDAHVLEIHTLKPLDVGLVREAAEETGAIVTAEEHSIIGGLGGAVAESLGGCGCCPVPIERVGIRDTFGVTALDVESLLDHCGMAIEDIVGAARRVIARK
jgi:transketolase